MVIGVAHEAFLSAWTPLSQVISVATSALRARRVVEQAATDWNDNGCSPTRLWERGQLAAAVADTGARFQAPRWSSAPQRADPSPVLPGRWDRLLRPRRVLVTDRIELSPNASAFLGASIRRDRFRRGRASTVLSVLLLLAVALAGIAVIQQRTAVGQRDVALSRQIAGVALALRATNPGLAAQLGLAAYRLAATTEARGSLLSAFANPYATRLAGHTSTVRAVAFSPEGHTLASASYDDTVRLWDVRDPHHSHLLSILTGHTNSVFSVVFSPQAHILASASYDSTVRLWDIRDPHNPRPLGILTGHTDAVDSVVFSADGNTLATASSDSTARLWDVSDPYHPHPLGTLAGHTDAVRAVAFSPDGHTVATTSSDTTARLWDVHDLLHPHPLGTLAGHTNTVHSVAFSPDGPILATTSSDSTARLWDVRDPHHPQPLGTLAGHTDAVRAVAFSSDGHTVATASYDTTARLWETDADRVAARICSITPPITRSEWDQYLPALAYQPPCA